MESSGIFLFLPPPPFESQMSGHNFAFATTVFGGDVYVGAALVLGFSIKKNRNFNSDFLLVKFNFSLNFEFEFI